MLGLLLGVLCDAHLLLDPKILKLLILGMLALLLSGIGGILGGYIMYYIKKGNYNPVIGIAAVSCVPTTAKVAQKIVDKTILIHLPRRCTRSQYIGSYYFSNYYRYLYHNHPAIMKQHESYLINFIHF